MYSKRKIDNLFGYYSENVDLKRNAASAVNDLFKIVVKEFRN